MAKCTGLGLMIAKHRMVSQSSRPRSTPTGLLLLALWLMLLAADSYQPFHVWLHGGKIPLNDDCAVAMVHHGKLHASGPAVNVSVTPAVSVGSAMAPAQVFSSVDFLLPSCRAPPAVLL